MISINPYTANSWGSTAVNDLGLLAPCFALLGIGVIQAVRNSYKVLADVHLPDV
jgi:hypothetical protein